MKFNLISNMNTFYVIITLKQKRNNTVEIELDENSLKAFKINLESNSKFLDISQKLYLNKEEILMIEINTKGEK